MTTASLQQTYRNPWERAKDAPSFLTEPEPEVKGLARDLLVLGAITLIAAPKGVGKSQVSLALAVALATGGMFRGEQVPATRVLLIDRENPRSIIKQRLRSWGAAGAPNLSVLTREDAPDLKNRRAWQEFPAQSYDVVIIDSAGSSTEGITEREGKQTTEVLAIVRDLAAKGPAILILQNATKDGLSYKGREEWADRVDILYEVRDATGFTPRGVVDWWHELPAAGAASFADRASRRKSRIDYRLAFIPAKFRLGPEPEPFCLELHLPEREPWTLEDVTERLTQQGKTADAAGEQAKAEKRERVTREFAAEVAAAAQRENPFNKAGAEAALSKKGCTQKEARQFLTDYDGKLWRLVPGQGKGGPILVLPMTSPDSPYTTESTQQGSAAPPQEEKPSPRAEETQAADEVGEGEKPDNDENEEALESQEIQGFQTPSLSLPRPEALTTMQGEEKPGVIPMTEIQHEENTEDIGKLEERISVEQDYQGQREYYSLKDTTGAGSRSTPFSSSEKVISERKGKSPPFSASDSTPRATSSGNGQGLSTDAVAEQCTQCRGECKLPVSHRELSCFRLTGG